MARGTEDDGSHAETASKGGSSSRVSGVMGWMCWRREAGGDIMRSRRASQMLAQAQGSGRGVCRASQQRPSREAIDSKKDGSGGGEVSIRSLANLCTRQPGVPGQTNAVGVDVGRVVGGGLGDRCDEMSSLGYEQAGFALVLTTPKTESGAEHLGCLQAATRGWMRRYMGQFSPRPNPTLRSAETVRQRGPRYKAYEPDRSSGIRRVDKAGFSRVQPRRGVRRRYDCTKQNRGSTTVRGHGGMLLRL